MYVGNLEVEYQNGEVSNETIYRDTKDQVYDMISVILKRNISEVKAFKSSVCEEGYWENI